MSEFKSETNWFLLVVVTSDTLTTILTELNEKNISILHTFLIFFELSAWTQIVEPQIPTKNMSYGNDAFPLNKHDDCNLDFVEVLTLSYFNS